MANDLGSGATDTNDFADISAMSFEQARGELSEVVARLEAGGEPLESSLALWERGEALAERCQQWLDGTRERLDAVTVAAGGEADESASARDRF